MSWVRLGVALAAAVFAGGAGAQPQDAAIPATLETASPLQLGLRELYAQRAAAGLPAPRSQYTYEIVEGAQPAAEGADGMRMLSAAEAGRTVRIVSRTVLAFDGPEQAGYDSGWPRLEFHDTVLPGLPVGVIDGDHTEAYRAYAEQMVPGVWEQVQFGREPRTYTIEETLTVTFPEGSTAPSALMRALGAEAIDSAQTVERILLGFTYDGPYIDKTIHVNLDFTLCLPWPFDDVCWTIPIFEFKAGFELWWAFGLRLPGEAAMSGPVELVSSLAPPAPAFSTSLEGTNWTSDDYVAWGVDQPGPAGHEGNEFVFDAHLWAGVMFLLFGQDPCIAVLGVPCYIDLDVGDVSKSFATPFGTGQYFPLSTVPVPIYKVGIEGTLSFDMGLQLTPLLGSSMITADALVLGETARGGGPLEYTEPDVAVPIDVAACISKGASRDASVQLGNFRYHFNEFGLVLGAYGRTTVMGHALSLDVDIYRVDLSRIFGSGLYVGGHVKCDAAFRCGPSGPDNVLALAAEVVDRDPPVTTLALAGTAGRDGWYRSDLVATLGAYDEPAGCDSGVAATEYVLAGAPATYAAPFEISAEGVTSFTYASRDVDGLAAETPHAFPLKIDRTAPTISGRLGTTPNDHGWFDHDVTVLFEAADLPPGPAIVPSGLHAVSPDPTLAAEGAGQSAAGTAEDVAGNSASTTVSGINIDKTPPTLEVTSPQAIRYENTQSFALTWLAADAVSAIAHEAGTVDGLPVALGESVPLLLFAPGRHVARVEVEDMADHAVDATVTFEVTVHLPGVLAAQAEICRLDWINKLGICNSLEAKLLAALASQERADLSATANALGAYLNELDAQWDKAVNAGAYVLLRADVEYLLAHLG